MRRPALIAALFGVALAGPVLAGGFGSGDSPPARIPVPARDYAAVVQDMSGTRVEVTQVSYNGEVFLYGLVGQGQVTVPFDSIHTVRFEPSTETGQRVAFVTLADGKTVNVVVDADLPAYGKTAWGTYSITVDKIRQIEFKR